jgi:hypothetical protein
VIGPRTEAALLKYAAEIAAAAKTKKGSETTR